MSVCDNASVGGLIWGVDGNSLLMFERATPPWGLAGVGGHVDTHGTYEDAIRAEVSEEVGLTAVRVGPVYPEPLWIGNRCRRTPGPRGVGHRWQWYHVKYQGDVTPNPREARHPRWITPGQLRALSARTAQFAAGKISAEDFKAGPGIEPVWVNVLLDLGLIPGLRRGDRERIERLAAEPYWEWTI
jgi:8-oxo-dGTP pyrophosphatase MutT (NUDIX family)